MMNADVICNVILPAMQLSQNKLETTIKNSIGIKLANFLFYCTADAAYCDLFATTNFQQQYLIKHNRFRKIFEGNS